MLTKKLKRIVPGSLGKVFGLLYGLIGLIIGVCLFVVSLFPLFFGQGFSWTSLMLLIFFPIAYGLFGCVIGYISAALYNFVAKKSGGIEFEVE